MDRLREIQTEQAHWSHRNFGPQPAWHMLLGVSEETGELCHAYLKACQGIREAGQEDAKDAVGDIVIYLMGLCNVKGWDLAAIIEETWDQVKLRDWKTNPSTGLVGVDPELADGDDADIIELTDRICPLCNISYAKCDCDCY